MSNSINKGKLFIISGPSGVGKGTICQKLISNTNNNMCYSISMTTRKQRPGEENGKDYFFVSSGEFSDAINNNELIEYAEFVGNYYGTPVKYCEEQIAKGKNVLLEIEVQGSIQVMQKRPEVISIFLYPPSITELENRLRERGTESEDLIKQRVKKAEIELNLKKYYKYSVLNKNLDEALNEIQDIIRENSK